MPDVLLLPVEFVQEAIAFLAQGAFLYMEREERISYLLLVPTAGLIYPVCHPE